jgi:hypothetical protein
MADYGILGALKRKETAQFRLKFDASNLTDSEKKKIFKVFDTQNITVKNFLAGDTLDITQKIDFLYFDDTVKRLNAILDTYSKASLLEASTKELRHGKCLIQETLAKIELVEQKFKESKERRK